MLKQTGPKLDVGVGRSPERGCVRDEKGPQRGECGLQMGDGKKNNRRKKEDEE